jgi:hypothetical protein
MLTGRLRLTTVRFGADCVVGQHAVVACKLHQRSTRLSALVGSPSRCCRPLWCLCKHSLQAESDATGQVNDALAAILSRLAVQHLTGHVINSVI